MFLGFPAFLILVSLSDPAACGSIQNHRLVHIVRVRKADGTVENNVFTGPAAARSAHELVPSKGVLVGHYVHRGLVPSSSLLGSSMGLQNTLGAIPVSQSYVTPETANQVARQISTPQTGYPAMGVFQPGEAIYGIPRRPDVIIPAQEPQKPVAPPMSEELKPAEAPIGQPPAVAPSGKPAVAPTGKPAVNIEPEPDDFAEEDIAEDDIDEEAEKPRQPDKSDPTLQKLKSHTYMSSLIPKDNLPPLPIPLKLPPMESEKAHLLEGVYRERQMIRAKLQRQQQAMDVFHPDRSVNSSTRFVVAVLMVATTLAILD